MPSSILHAGVNSPRVSLVADLVGDHEHFTALTNAVDDMLLVPASRAQYDRQLNALPFEVQQQQQQRQQQERDQRLQQRLQRQQEREQQHEQQRRQQQAADEERRRELMGELD